MLKKIIYLIYLLLSLINLRYLSKKLDNILCFLRSFLLKLLGAKIGKNSKILSGVIILKPKNIIIGDNTNIGINSKIYNYSKVFIGNNVDIGPELYINTNNHTFKDPNLPLAYQDYETEDIKIGSNIWIGARVIMLKKTQLENNIVIGAGTLINRKLQSGYLYAGIPAEKKKKLNLI